MLREPLRLTFCAVPVLPAMRYGAPRAIIVAVPPPWIVAIMPSCTARRCSALLVMRGPRAWASGFQPVL